MPTSLHDISKRSSDIRPFLRKVFAELRGRLLSALQDNTPGKTLPEQWTHTVTIQALQGTLRIFNTRLEGDRAQWESIFHYLNEGTRTHYIEPVNAQALRWEDDFGDVHFSKGHIVSGILPAYFAEQADRIIADFEKTVQSKWSTWMSTGRYV